MDTQRYFLCFILYSFIGWLYESLYYTVRRKRLVNSGFLYGCLCPIYGIGGLLDVALLGNMNNAFKIFVAGMFVTGVLEYVVSYVLEQIFHKRWWDYSTWPFNINGRVCLLGAFAFGTMGVLLIKYINPAAVSCFSDLSDKTVSILTKVLAFCVIADLAATIKNSDKFDEKLWFVDKPAEIMHSVSEQKTEFIEKIKSRILNK